jgi:hypothetical protein
MSVVATTNHDHAVAAGARERRKVVYDVSDEYVGNRNYFDALYRDLASGGTSEFLWLLLNLKLGEWHPRMILRTLETEEQQRMSSDSVAQWAQACIDADAIAVPGQPPEGLDLGALISFRDLLDAYNGFCRKTASRALTTVNFGKACTEMFGPKIRLPAVGNKRPWGYAVPAGASWQNELDKRVGVK